MKRLASYLFVFLLAVSLAAPAQAEIQIADFNVKGTDMKLFTEVRVIGTVQALDQSDNTGSLTELGPGIDTAFGDMAWRLEVGDYAEMYFDVTQASRVHPDRWWGHEGYMTFKRFPEYSPLASLNGLMHYINLKAGHFDLAYGWYPETSSINAEVQKNPLVGNTLVRPLATEPGVEVIGTNQPINWIVGAGIGTSTGDFDENRGWSYHTRIWKQITPMVELAGSFYRVDHSDKTSLRFGGGPGHLFASERMGSRYGGVWGGGGNPGQILLGNGVDVTAWQLDLRTNPMPGLVFDALYGNFEDADLNAATQSSTPRQEWDYYAATLKKDLTKYLYGALRYSGAELQKDEGFSNSLNGTNGDITRLQAGVGLWVTHNILLKLEYVDQEAENFTTDPTAGANLTRDPQFDGLVTEVSMTY